MSASDSRRPARRALLAAPLAIAGLSSCGLSRTGTITTASPRIASEGGAASDGGGAPGNGSDGSGSDGGGSDAGGSAPAAPGIDASAPYLRFPPGGSGTQKRHVLLVLLDFRCPFCKQFSDVNTAQLQALSNSGQLEVRIAPRPMLDRGLGGSYSLDTAGIYTAAFAQSPGLAWKVEKHLYAHQVPEDAHAPDRAALISAIRPLGLDAQAVQRATRGVYDSWLTDVVEESYRAAGLGTPTLILDDVELTDVDWRDAAALRARLLS